MNQFVTMVNGTLAASRPHSIATSRAPPETQGANMIRQGTFAVVLTLAFTALSQNANATDSAGNAGPRAYDS
jgi:hypothetical protein